jgi:hypothetical protein
VSKRNRKVNKETNGKDSSEVTLAFERRGKKTYRKKQQ